MLKKNKGGNKNSKENVQKGKKGNFKQNPFYQL